MQMQMHALWGGGGGGSGRLSSEIAVDGRCSPGLRNKRTYKAARMTSSRRIEDTPPSFLVIILPFNRPPPLSFSLSLFLVVPLNLVVARCSRRAVLRIFRGYEIAIWMAAAVRRGRAGFVRGTSPRQLAVEHSRPYLKRLFSTGPFPRVFLPFVNALVKILPSCPVNVVRGSVRACTCISWMLADRARFPVSFSPLIFGMVFIYRTELAGSSITAREAR